MSVIGCALAYWVGRWHLLFGFCPQCNSSPPEPACPVCHGSRAYSHDAGPVTRQVWRQRFDAHHERAGA